MYLIQYLAATCGQEIDTRVVLLREDMAAMIGVRVESVSRIIAELKRDGIPRPLGREIYEYDPIALKHYAEI